MSVINVISRGLGCHQQTAVIQVIAVCESQLKLYFPKALYSFLIKFGILWLHVFVAEAVQSVGVRAFICSSSAATKTPLEKDQGVGRRLCTILLLLGGRESSVGKCVPLRREACCPDTCT